MDPAAHAAIAIPLEPRQSRVNSIKTILAAGGTILVMGSDDVQK
jgi:hypothetical protein